MLSPIILLFYQENGLNYKHLFLFQGIFYLTSIISEFPAGFFCDKMSRRNVLLVSFSIYIVVIVLWLCFHGFFIILIGEILFAISKVCMDNATSCYLYDFLSKKNNTKEMPKQYSYLNFFLALGTAAAGIIGAKIFEEYGSAILLTIELILMLIAVKLILKLPNIGSTNKERKSKRIFLNTAKEIFNNNLIKYHICYSGILTAFSILFAISFQPLMQHASIPIIVFGIIASINHGTRAFFSILSEYVIKYIKINNLALYLYILYIIALCMLIICSKTTNQVLIISMLIIICLIIGLQLIFTINHIARIHKYINKENRGCLMSVNNIVSRGLAAVYLISSKMLLNVINLSLFYEIFLIIFVVSSSYIMYKTYKTGE